MTDNPADPGGIWIRGVGVWAVYLLSPAPHCPDG